MNKTEFSNIPFSLSSLWLRSNGNREMLPFDLNFWWKRGAMIFVNVFFGSLLLPFFKESVLISNKQITASFRRKREGWGWHRFIRRSFSLTLIIPRHRPTKSWCSIRVSQPNRIVTATLATVYLATQRPLSICHMQIYLIRIRVLIRHTKQVEKFAKFISEPFVCNRNPPNPRTQSEKREDKKRDKKWQIQFAIHKIVDIRCTKNNDWKACAVKR